MNDLIDLRSDSVTLPPAGMLQAMCQARLGDDVYGEDPTVNSLEAKAAEMLGTEAALLVPSGTMANLLALMAHCPRGTKVLVGERSDLWLWEAGGASVLGSLVYHPIPTQPNGELAIDDLDAAIFGQDDPQCAIVRSIAIENTHCLCGGRVLTLDYLQRLRGFTHQRGLALHLDGSRIFNATVALGLPVQQIAGYADSVSFCLSKGLAAPIGSVLAGNGDFIAAARRLRKMVGGGMRQAGVIAAAGIFALEHMIDRLAEDHANARRLADGLSSVPGLRLDPALPETNIVFWSLEEDLGLAVGTFLSTLERQGVRVLELGKGRLRAVPHFGITADQIDRAIDVIARAVRQA
ncbi:MAG TPA: low-specificity L-threonine aldolase [Thermoanaerobaculia bacterium]|nr:low-specificity L-threonine aldolase [Thermoanaerobaculia bacterium]